LSVEKIGCLPGSGGKLGGTQKNLKTRNECSKGSRGKVSGREGGLKPKERQPPFRQKKKICGRGGVTNLTKKE